MCLKINWSVKGLVWELLAPSYGLLTVTNTFDVVRRTRDDVKWDRRSALFWKGAVIRPIYKACTNDVDATYSKFECLGYPRGKGKNSMLSFYATIAIGQFFPVILAFPRWRWANTTRTGVTNSTIAEDVCFNYLYLKLTSLARIELYSKHCHYIRSCSIHYTD